MKPALFIGLGALVAGAVVYSLANRGSALPAGVEIGRLSHNPYPHGIEAGPSAGLCPWRDRDADRLRFFPASTASRDETLILSRRRVELKERLGRMPVADDNAIIVHRVLGLTTSPGVVVTRRVRGECGLVELVLATNSNGRVVGARIQRHREPDATARVIESEAWLAAFRGKDCRSQWKLGADIPSVPPEARVTANSIVREARTVLILLDVARHSDTSLPHDGSNGRTGNIAG